METRIATTFMKVAELGSITRAAEQLGYSQGAVTLQIKQLEDGLGVPLFDRIGRGIQLTDAGRRFQEYAARLVSASKDADAFALDAKEPEGLLIIEATSSISIGILTQVLHRFRDNYPKIKVSVRLGEDPSLLVDHVRQNRADFAAFTAPKVRFDGCALAAERKEEFRFVAGPTDPLILQKNVPLEKVLDDTYVATCITTDWDRRNVYFLENTLKERGFDVHPSLEFATIAAVVHYIKCNGGHAYLPLSMIENELARQELCILDTEIIDNYNYIQVVHSATRWINPQMKAFSAFMKQELEI